MDPGCKPYELGYKLSRSLCDLPKAKSRIKKIFYKKALRTIKYVIYTLHIVNYTLHYEKLIVISLHV